MVITSVDDLDFEVSSLPAMPPALRVLLTAPDHYAIEYVINPHMQGNIGTVEKDIARTQWELLASAYRDVGIEVRTIPGVSGYPDMVFCANQTLPYLSDDLTKQGVVLSTMHAHQRRGEVEYYRAFFDSVGYETIKLSDGVDDFEGMGDAVWHPRRRMLWGGYGFRTTFNAYDEISRTLDVPIIALRLDDPDFYHLDTCLSVLSESDALIYSGAFNDAGLALIRSVFKRTIEVPEEEARTLFAANAHCPDARHVLIQSGCVETNEALRDCGYLPIEIDTSEYLKSGGSVFCMKQMFW